MRKKLVLLLTLAIGISGSASAPAPAVPMDRAVVAFVSTKTLAGAQAVARSHGVSILSYISEYSGSNEEALVALSYQPDPEINVGTDYLPTMTSVVQDIRYSMNALADPLDPIVQSQINNLDAVEQGFASGETSVLAIIVEGTAAAIQDMKEDFANVSSVSSEADAAAARAGTENNPPTGCRTPWWPSNGAARAARVESGGTDRYVYQRFRFTSTRISNLRACGLNITYEHEAVLNNYDGLNYFPPSSVATPRAVGSNLPRKYWDVRVFDSGNELNFAMGSADARRLVAGTQYWTYIRSKPGNASSDTAKISAQRGHRWPSFCYSTWCIYPDATNHVVPAWAFSVPGNYWWSN